jgi:hypothetical protein
MLRERRPKVDVWFLSARYGFHPVSLPIPDYDQMMTEARACELLRLPSSNRAAFGEVVDKAPRVMFAGGMVYRETMHRACICKPVELAETDSPGIGYHRAQLRAWLFDICGAPVEL